MFNEIFYKLIKEQRIDSSVLFPRFWSIYIGICLGNQNDINVRYEYNLLTSMT